MKHLLKMMAAFALVSALVQAEAASAEEVKVLGPTPFRGVLVEVSQAFELQTGHTLSLEFDSVGAVKQRIEANEEFDLAIVVPAMLDDLVAKGFVVADSRVDLARDGFALAVRSGAQKPDIGTVEAFKAAMLGAESVAMVVGGAAGRAHFDPVFERLGIADQMEPKFREVPSPGGAVQAVREGEAEMGFMITSVILGAQGIDLVGRLPEEVQFPIVFSAGISSIAQQAEGPKALIDFLRTPEAAAVIEANGMEPVS
jgi:molybdate transport system substrate-binding protein